MAVPQGFLEHHAGTGKKSCIMGEEADILHVFATMHAEERRRLQEVDEKNDAKLFRHRS